MTRLIIRRTAVSTSAYLDPALSPRHRIEDLLSRMTLEEKAG